MDALERQRRLRAFRATDAYALEAYRLASSVPTSRHADVLDALRRSAVRSGASVVAATAHGGASAGERRLLGRARGALLEGRYYLYAARRLGLVDLRRYRSLAARQDAALKEIERCLGRDPAEVVLACPADLAADGAGTS